MLSAFKRPFAPPNAVIYSYELSKLFLDGHITSILEIGCGIGIFATRYASSRKDTFVMGVDYSEQTVAFLSSVYGQYYSNLQLQQYDFCEPNLYLGRTFDAVYSSDVLEHVTDVQSFAKNIHHHLNAGGKAVINFPNETNHGINHFNDADDLRRLFATFSEVKVYVVNIKNPLDKFWFAIRSLYESLLSRSTKKRRKQLYSEREEQGIDYFEDSTCFSFVKDKGKLHNMLASVFAETFLLIKPTIDVRQVEHENILNSPRIVVVATK